MRKGPLGKAVVDNDVGASDHSRVSEQCEMDFATFHRRNHLIWASRLSLVDPQNAGLSTTSGKTHLEPLSTYGALVFSVGFPVGFPMIWLCVVQWTPQNAVVSCWFPFKTNKKGHPQKKDRPIFSLPPVSSDRRFGGDLVSHFSALHRYGENTRNPQEILPPYKPGH